MKIYEDKYSKAAKCFAKDRDKLLRFYDFPAMHWQHIRTTNPIESTFATVRLRTNKTRNCCSRDTVMTIGYPVDEERIQEILYAHFKGKLRCLS